jgi:hypothetical protein
MVSILCLRCFLSFFFQPSSSFLHFSSYFSLNFVKKFVLLEKFLFTAASCIGFFSPFHFTAAPSASVCVSYYLPAQLFLFQLLAVS